MCFVENTTSMLKVSLKSMFGPCVMIILFLAYFGQKIISYLMFKDEAILETLKSKICKAYLIRVNVCGEDVSCEQQPKNALIPHIRALSQSKIMS